MNTRQERILELLFLEGDKSVEQLVESLKVSDMTIRRDLAYLESEGRVVRTWGGAKLTEKQILDFSFREKNNTNRDEKRRIGERGASLVAAGNYVLLDTGTTALQVARMLRSISAATVFTCSLPIVSELIDIPRINLTMLGGTVQPRSMEVYGPLTEKNFMGVKTDIAFVGADAVGPAGELLTTGMETARVAELILQSSVRKVLVVDSSKWDLSAPVAYGRLSDITTVITGGAIRDKTRMMIEKSGAELLLV